MEEKRALGVKIFVWVCIILPIVYFLSIAFLLPIFIAPGAIPPRDLFLLFPLELLLISPFLLIGIGLLRFKNIARQILLVISFIIFIISFGSIIIFFIHFFSGHPFFVYGKDKMWFIGFLLFFIGSIFTIYYFTRPKIKEQFKKEEIPNA